MKTITDKFHEIWCLDFEFQANSGERPNVHCMVAIELQSGREVQLWLAGNETPPPIPFDTGPDNLFVAFYAPAEWGCFLKFDWPLPDKVLDLYVEFRAATNGIVARKKGNADLLAALRYYGLDRIDDQEKTDMRALAIRGGPFTDQERKDLLEYCKSDVVALPRLLSRLAPDNEEDLQRALLRGRYTKAVARMEYEGTPIDRERLDLLVENWEPIKLELIDRIDGDYGVFDNGSFRRAKFEQYLSLQGILWPRYDTGALNLKEPTFKDMARVYPQLNDLRELRSTLSDMRTFDLVVGGDDRNRCMLSQFGTVTARNTASSKAFIFGPSCWVRSLIRAEPGWGIAYVDWSQQEFGIAAKLSNDPAMIAAYEQGDPYLAFAIQAGRAPGNATKASHGKVRDLFKSCALGVLFGMGANTLSLRIGQPVVYAKELIGLHKRTYREFWRWMEGVLSYAMMHNVVHTVFGWPLHVTSATKVGTLRNCLMQGNGAEMLRLAASYATEAGIHVCAPVHDALLITSPLSEMDDAIVETQRLMRKASEDVLDGFPLRTDVDRFDYPRRYRDKRGIKLWTTIWEILGMDPDLD